jgi:hypothetical protein
MAPAAGRGPAACVPAHAQVVAHGQPREGHLSAHEQRHALFDDLFGLEVGRVHAEDADDAAVGMREPRDGAQQGGLPGPVRPEQGHHLALGDLQVHVEEHLVGAVVEVEVVNLEGRELAARLTTFALGEALDDVLDDQRDVPPHEARADQQQHTTGHAHRCDEGERDDDAVQPADGVGDRAEDHAAGESAEHQRVHAEHGEADGPHFGRCRGGQGQEDADGERRHRRLGHELEGHAEPELGDVEGDDEERAVGGDAEPGNGQRALGRPPEVVVPDHVGHR